jgi:hypothetical protein
MRCRSSNGVKKAPENVTIPAPASRFCIVPLRTGSRCARPIARDAQDGWTFVIADRFIEVAAVGRAQLGVFVERVLPQVIEVRATVE